MTRQLLLESLATVFLISVGVVVLIDLAAEAHPRFCYFKWTAAWYTARFMAIICGALLSLHVLFGESP